MNEAQVKLELFKTGLSVLLLLLTWVVGQRILAFWERRKKQSEIDLASLAQLHRIHAEFRTIGRLWRSFGLRAADDQPVEVPPDVHWDLQRRAAAAEGEMEALVVKLATERVLTDDQVNALGFLREAYQLLRRRIRDREWFYWKSGSDNYNQFYKGAIDVAEALSKATPRPTSEEAVRTVARVRAASELVLAQVERMDRDGPPPDRSGRRAAAGA